ncbi:MAG: DUF4386 family protein [Chloroflexi bacterium]|jgi:hypothetical protein|nr:DUF4386 family protein [Chloroflexota bacterium]
MPKPTQNIAKDTGSADPRWIDLYKIAAVTSIIFPISIILAVVAYFIWPYTPGLVSVADIFDNLHRRRLGGLVSLDLFMVLLMPVGALLTLAMYAALREVNESYALIALVLGLMGYTVIFAARPVAEMAYLSEQYAAASDEVAKSHYLAAGEALHALFNGTAWMASMALVGISGVICSVLMLRSRAFTKATAYAGIVVTVTGLGVFVPGIGALLSLAATIGGVIWYGLMARDFYRLGWGITR